MHSNKEGTVLNLQVGNSMVLIKNNAIKLHEDKIILNKKSIGEKIMNTREEILKIKNEITSEGWNALGINGTNADFWRVE